MVKASGALPGNGGDVELPQARRDYAAIAESWLIEAKTTVTAKQFVLTKDILEKLIIQASRKGRNPALVIEIDGLRGVWIPEELFWEECT